MKDARKFTNYKNALANRNMLMLATVGSESLGLAKKENSDIDEMGVCIEQPKELLGFSPFEHDLYRTAYDRTGKFDAKSEPGDIDLTIYGLRKFVRLALGGNPNLITLFYLPEESFSVYTKIAAELRELTPVFASKETVKAFLGYLKAQRMRLEGTRGGMDVNRHDLVNKYGYDTKYAMHMYRLAMQGNEFARTGRLSFPLSTAALEALQEIRDGHRSIEAVLKDTEYYENSTLKYLALDTLPDKPDYNKIEEWLLNVYERVWHEDKTSSQQQGLTTNIAGQDKGTSKADSETLEDSIPF